MAIVPLHYSLTLDLALEERSFSGRVSVDLAVDVTTSSITLDSSGLTIEGATLAGATIPIREDGDSVTLVAPAATGPGTVTVALEFRGSMQPFGRGLFRSGDFAATHLQPAYAPLVFPCVNHPRHKSTFALSVSTSPGHVVVANARLESVEAVGNRRHFRFATSPPMPVHLFGLAAGPFFIISGEADGVSVRVFSSVDDGRNTFVLEEATRSLRICRATLGVPYPWSHLDLVILPDLGAAGLEMTSLIFLRESAVQKRGSAAARLVAHEVAHQWFGCHVTPASWDDLWLSEGFATWLASKVMADLDADGEERLSARARRAAMSADSLRSSRALRTAATDPADIHELFDIVAYQKGAALLQMLESWLGEASFERGIGSYLARHGHGHASASDLWRALEDESGKPVVVVASRFAERQSVPTIRCDRNGRTVTVAQQGGTDSTIPVTVKFGSSTGEVATAAALLDSGPVALGAEFDVEWVMGNAKGIGYYRCSYAQRQRWPLQSLSGPEAITVLCDAWDQLWHGESDVVDYLRTVEALSAHSAAKVVLAEHLSELRDLLAVGDTRAEGFQRWWLESVADVKGLAETASIAHAAWERVKVREDAALSFDDRADLAALGGFADIGVRAQIAGFYAGRKLSGGQRTLEQALEKIDSRIAFRQREQIAFDAWLARRTAPALGADGSLRDAYALLNAIAGGLHGALVHRMWIEGLGMDVPAWMQPASQLQAALGALERRLVAVFRGVAVVDEALFELSARLEEDLLASASLAAAALGSSEPAAEAAAAPPTSAARAATLAALLARNAAVHDRSLRGAILFAELFGQEELGRELRARLHGSEQERSRIRHLLDRVRTGKADATLVAGVFTAAAMLPAIQRSQAADLKALGMRAGGEK